MGHKSKTDNPSISSPKESSIAPIFFTLDEGKSYPQRAQNLATKRQEEHDVWASCMYVP